MFRNSNYKHTDGLIDIRTYKVVDRISCNVWNLAKRLNFATSNDYKHTDGQMYGRTECFIETTAMFKN